MPNWVVNNVKFICDNNKFKEILDYVKSEETDFDFNKIVPLDSRLKKITDSSSLQEDISYYINVVDKSLLNNKKLNKFKDIKYNKEIIEKYFDYEKNLENAKLAIECFLDTGYYSWYNARVDKWGTKWNAIEVYIDKEKTELEFQTAWSCPIEIFEELSKKFNIGIVVEYCDEDYNSNTGIATFNNGISYIKPLEEGDDDFDRIVKQSWGEDIFDDEE